MAGLILRGRREAMESTLNPYNSAEHFRATEDQIVLLTDALESRDLAYISHALCIVAKAADITKLEMETGLTSQQLDKALSVDGNPTLATVVKVLRVLGLKLTIQRI